MQIVIEISEELKQKIDEGFTNQVIISKLWDATKNGTPLPEGHGDLVDRNDLLAESYVIDDYAGNEINIVDRMTVEMVDAIIEADKAESGDT